MMQNKQEKKGNLSRLLSQLLKNLNYVFLWLCLLFLHDLYTASVTAGCNLNWPSGIIMLP